ncbi:MAG: PIG-L family deacetylase [Oscillospiraceae bacterium]|nr:PIG-L family deacetylase [Oscillospiraceae bacterium]
MRKYFLLILTLILLLSMLPLGASADGIAADISGKEIVTASEGFDAIDSLFDGKLLAGKKTADTASLTLESAEGIGSLYFIFGAEYGAYTVTDNATGESRTLGENRFLHEFVDLTVLFGTAPKSVTVSFTNGAADIYELYIFTPGQVPDFVQKWEAPADGKTDLVLFSTHGDDEQLFFAGVLPYYAGELGYQVQVVYFTDHRKDTNVRIHEMLDGLWTVGVTAYPVFGEHDDFLRWNSLAGTYAEYLKRGYTRDELLGFVVEQVRRFKPLVAVGHDLKGEYSHGMHMVYADLLTEAVRIASDPAYFPELAEQYGVWDTPKTYLHLYEENPIVMDWDRPLEAFDGMTAYQVSRDLGFACHKSQRPNFSWYFHGADTAAKVKEYNPCYFGLYRSTVGEDVQKNDFFENVTTYAEQDRQEAERLKAEEEARLAAEAAAREEAERASEEAARQEATQTPPETGPQPAAPEGVHDKKFAVAVVAFAIASILLIVVLILRRKPGKSK